MSEPAPSPRPDDRDLPGDRNDLTKTDGLYEALRMGHIPDKYCRAEFPRMKTDPRDPPRGAAARRPLPHPKEPAS